MEYEKSTVNAGLFYKNAEERERLIKAERKYTDGRVLEAIALKKKVCDGTDYSFIVVNQKGIDPPSLDMLQGEGIVAVRRAKRRNMERIPLACGGYAVNSFENLSEDCLGYAETVYEHQLGEDVFTFIEGCKKANSCTVLITGPDEQTINQIKDAVHDGLRAVANVYRDKALLPGAGCFEAQAHTHLTQWKKTVAGRTKLGVQAFADALLVIPRTLAENSGHDPTDAIIALLEDTSAGRRVGIDIETGKTLLPEKQGIWDNVNVKRQFISLGSLIAMKLMLVDEVMRAGKKMSKE